MFHYESSLSMTAFLFQMTEEKNLTKIKKKKKQIKKSLPKNVFEIVGDAGELVERVEPKETGKVEKKRKEKADGDEKVQLSERTRKRKVENSGEKRSSQNIF